MSLKRFLSQKTGQGVLHLHQTVAVAGGLLNGMDRGLQRAVPSPHGEQVLQLRSKRLALAEAWVKELEPAQRNLANMGDPALRRFALKPSQAFPPEAPKSSWHDTDELSITLSGCNVSTNKNGNTFDVCHRNQDFQNSEHAFLM